MLCSLALVLLLNAAMNVGVFSRIHTTFYFVPLLEQIQRGGWMLHRNPFQQPCESVGVQMSDIPLHSFTYPQAYLLLTGSISPC